MTDSLAHRLRAEGMRVTRPRERVFAAVSSTPHCTPEVVADVVAADGGRPLAASTIYRALEALEALGLITHTHLDHHAPSYHVAGHSHHIHLVCRDCGAQSEAPEAAAESLVRILIERHGFEADITHMAIHGRCASCLKQGQ